MKPERRFFVIWWWGKNQSWLRGRPDALPQFLVGQPFAGPFASRAAAEEARRAFGADKAAEWRMISGAGGPGAPRWYQKHTRVVSLTLAEFALLELGKLE